MMLRTLELLTPGKPAKLERTRCSRQRFSPCGCRRCLDVCPHDAIGWTDAGLEHDESRCQGCLLCVAVCPTGAMGAVGIDLFSRLEALCREERPVLSCSQHAQAQGHARLPCLGMLANAELLSAISLVLARPWTLNLSSCAGCLNEAMVARLDPALRRATAGGGADHVRVHLAKSANEVDFREAGLSRRALFTLFRNKTRQGTTTLLHRLQPDLPREYRGKGLPQSRALLLRVLTAYPDRSLAERFAAAFPNIEITDACTGCTGCVGVCPTGALAPPSDASGKPVFLAQLCTACGVCQVFCRSSAIVVASELMST